MGTYSKFCKACQVGCKQYLHSLSTKHIMSFGRIEAVDYNIGVCQVAGTRIAIHDLVNMVLCHKGFVSNPAALKKWKGFI